MYIYIASNACSNLFKVRHEVLQQKGDSARFVQSIVAEVAEMKSSHAAVWAQDVETTRAMAHLKWSQSEEDITLKIQVAEATKKEDVTFKALEPSETKYMQ